MFLSIVFYAAKLDFLNSRTRVGVYKFPET